MIRKRPAEIPMDKLVPFCQRSNIVEMALFGSVLRDDFADRSDIDVLVQFDAESRITFFDLQEIEEGLSALMCGRKVWSLGRG